MRVFRAMSNINSKIRELESSIAGKNGSNLKRRRQKSRAFLPPLNLGKEVPQVNVVYGYYMDPYPQLANSGMHTAYINRVVFLTKTIAVPYT